MGGIYKDGHILSGLNQESDNHGATLLLGFIPVVPFAFLGLGIYRAWIEICFAGSFVEYPFDASWVHNAFDLAMAATLLLCSACARKVVSFYGKTWPFVTSGLLLTLGTGALFATMAFPQWASCLGLPAAVFGGVGIALLILIWSEAYGCLNPSRVLAYYTLSIIVGALVIYVYEGFKTPWLVVMTSLLPLLSLLCVQHAFRLIPVEDRPNGRWSAYSVPWKLIAFMALYAFAYSLLDGTQTERPHSHPAVLVTGLVVFLLSAQTGRLFSLSVLYRTAFPIMVAALLLLPALGIAGSTVGSVCTMAGYTLQSVLIMGLFANLCYRQGVSAIWLFGIERGVRHLSTCMGRLVAGHMLTSANEMAASLLTGVAVLSVVVATMLLMKQRGLSDNWGAVALPTEGDALRGQGGGPVPSKQILSDRVACVAQAHGLSSREEEVLLLLSQRKTIKAIEEELFIANGTAKAHVRHIYQKLDIHTRAELYGLMELDDSGAGE